MKETTLFPLTCILLFVANITKAQEIYSNGNLNTGVLTASGVNAPEGYTWSELQNETDNFSEANSFLGFATYYSSDNSNSFTIADDFVVPASETWNVTSFDFFIYQNNYNLSTPPINELKIRLYNGNPSNGGEIIAGNLTTNVFDAANSIETNIYRIANSIAPSPGIVPSTTRKIWKIRGILPCQLIPGTYWVEFQAHSTNNSSLFSPLVTETGVRGLPIWNSQINTIASTFSNPILGWANSIDVGFPNTALDYNQAMPFSVNGSINSLSTYETYIDKNVLLSPNPVKDVLRYLVSAETIVNSYMIVNLYGETIENKSQADSKSEINLSRFSSGIYILKLFTDKGIIIKKFVKE